MVYTVERDCIPFSCEVICIIMELLADLVYQPWGLTIMLSPSYIVIVVLRCHHHLCTPLFATGLDTEAFYLVHIGTNVPHTST